MSILEFVVKARITKLACVRVGVDVSGGPDSMALLNALLVISKSLNLQLFVISVNHNIRPKEETSSDAQFVHDFCVRNGIACKIVTFGQNQVAQCEKERKKGTEEAARFLRYAVFEDFAKEFNLSVICLGHTKSDQLETLLQRFLQGSDVSSLAGIPEQRGIFFRPLLSCTRDDVMDYIAKTKTPYVIDKTNNENAYLRNKTRNILIPLLNEYYSGWQTALLHGAEKIACDVDLINGLVESAVWERVSDDVLCMNRSDFFSYHESIQRRILQCAVTILGCTARIPYAFFMEALKNRVLSGYGLVIENNADKIWVKIQKTTGKRCGFSAIIERVGTIRFLGFSADIVDTACVNNAQDSVVGPFSLPLRMRSANSSDFVETAEGKHKKISDIFSSWKIPEIARSSVPIIESNGVVLAICASFLGYQDWYVRHSCTSDNKIWIQFNKELKNYE